MCLNILTNQQQQKKTNHSNFWKKVKKKHHQHFPNTAFWSAVYSWFIKIISFQKAFSKTAQLRRLKKGKKIALNDALFCTYKNDLNSLWNCLSSSNQGHPQRLYEQVKVSHHNLTLTLHLCSSKCVLRHHDNCYSHSCQTHYVSRVHSLFVLICLSTFEKCTWSLLSKKPLF